MTRAARTLATFFGTGLSPRAPGTVASIAAALPLLLPCPDAAYRWIVGSLAVAAYVLSVWSARVLFSDHVERSDPGWFVLDEACGVWIAAWRPWHISPTDLLVSVILFRIFDIWKPGPVDSAQYLPGGHGIVADDALAGFIVLAFMLLT